MCPNSNITMYWYNVLMNKSIIFSLVLMTSLLVGTSLNMISPAMAAMGTNSYDNRYNYEKQPSYNDGYDKSSYSMGSYGDRYNDDRDKKSSYSMDDHTVRDITTTEIRRVPTVRDITTTEIRRVPTVRDITTTEIRRVPTSWVHTVRDITTTKIRLKNMNVEQVHLKDSLPAQ